ncbi:F-box protein At4g19940-like [Papaver somniferum]|uniref:F-box protein At4g19940-like n=1 Tax=Papaver somniferum TaxID=3469 RepID=UPI000E700C7C|nr:F-box protein At4g19940-like [Papaver somniferum]
MNKHGKCMKQKLQKKKKQKQQQKYNEKLELAPAELGGNHETGRHKFFIFYRSNKKKKNREILVSGTTPVLSSDVPEGIICEILSRLPVKSLMRFKCVRKRWQTLIQKDDFFIDLNYSRSKAAHYASLVCIGELRLKDMLNDITCLISMELLLPSKENGYVAAAGAISLWKYPFPKYKRVFSTTNGLLCVTDLIEYSVCIYNISTRESTPWIKSTFIRLKQEEDNKQELYRDFFLHKFGLGYDAVTKEHKVVAVWKCYASDELVSEVLTVRHNTWRRIDAVVPPLSGKGCFICWLHFHHHCEEPCFIQFDVGLEKFKKINILLLNPIFLDDLHYRHNLIDIDHRWQIGFVTYELRYGGQTNKDVYIS